MNDERALARIEQQLASDDPALARRISVLNRRLAGPAGDGGPRDHKDEGLVIRHADDEEATAQDTDGGAKRSWTVKVAVALAVVAAVGLLLTAILSAPGSGDRPPPQPYGLAPAASPSVLADSSGSGMS